VLLCRKFVQDFSGPMDSFILMEQEKLC